MKISEFIEQLQERQREIGDVQVVTPAMDEIGWCCAEINGVVDIGGERMLEINYDGDVLVDD